LQAVDETRLRRYAELVVRVGANVQPGQDLAVEAYVEHAPLARAIARAGYEAGARHVEVVYADQFVQLARLERAPEDSLGWVPEWQLGRLRSLAERKGARIAIRSLPFPRLLDGIDRERLTRSQNTKFGELASRQHTTEAVAWTLCGYPTEGWAEVVLGEPDVERLWEAVAHCVRLDAEDPTEAWREHVARLRARAAVLNERRFDALRFRGPGTDLTVGLFPQSRWDSGGGNTVFGQGHVANLPTEEVFTTPNSARTEGTVRSTRPLTIGGGLVIGLEMRFEGGSIVEVKARQGAELVEAQLAKDAGARRLGEVALVDGTSRVGETGLVFFDTLFDENATCHIAYGRGFADCIEGGAGKTPEELGINDSSIHTDFMIGGPEVDVDGVTTAGEVVPLVRGDVWQLS
jgi:aminopeptidase